MNPGPAETKFKQNSAFLIIFFKIFFKRLISAQFQKSVSLVNMTHEVQVVSAPSTSVRKSEKVAIYYLFQFLSIVVRSKK